MFSNESSRHNELSKLSKNSSSNKLSSYNNNSLSNSIFRNKYHFTQRNITSQKSQRNEQLKKSLIRQYTKRIKKKKTMLYKIKEEEKDENIIRENDNNKYRNPKISIKEILKNIKQKFFYQKYNKYYYNINKKICNQIGKEKPSIYGYFQINNIMKGKRCRLKVEFDEYNFYFNDREYCIDFFDDKKSNESILRFMLNFLYDNNIYNKNLIIDKINKYRITQFKKFINIFISNKIHDKYNNYKTSILYSVIKNIQEIKNRNITNESIINDKSFIDEIKFIKNKDLFEFDNIDDIINKMDNYLKYLPILINVPIIKFNSILPNYFCFDYKINFYLKNYLTKRSNRPKKYKINEKSKINKNKNKSKLRKGYIGGYSFIFNDSVIRGKGISFSKKDDNYDDILDNDIYFTKIYEQSKNKIKEKPRRTLIDHEIIDIQNFVDNLILLKKKKRNKVVSFDDKINDKDDKDNLIIKRIKNVEDKKTDGINLDISSMKILGRSKGILKLKPKNNEEKNKILEYNFKKSNSKLNYKIIPNQKIIYSLSDTKNTSIPYNESTKTNAFEKKYKLNNIIYNTHFPSEFILKRKIYNSQNHKYKFKKTNCFINQSMRNFKRFNLNNIEIKNIKINNINKNLKDYFIKVKKFYKYVPLKSENIEENIWKKGIFMENQTKLENNINKIMKKIHKKEKHKTQRNYENFREKYFTIVQMSRKADIYI